MVSRRPKAGFLGGPEVFLRPFQLFRARSSNESFLETHHVETHHVGRQLGELETRAPLLLCSSFPLLIPASCRTPAKPRREVSGSPLFVRLFTATKHPPSGSTGGGRHPHLLSQIGTASAHHCSASVRSEKKATPPSLVVLQMARAIAIKGRGPRTATCFSR